jgi:hypothetical protein
MKLITLAQARAHVRVDHTMEDEQIDAFIEAASSAVVNYLKSGADTFLNTLGLPEEIYSSDSPPEVLDYVAPDEVKVAVKILVGYFFRNRDGRDPGADGWQQGYLPAVVTALLYPLRDPTLA